ncbi:hypothetical protein [Actinokineospora sp.]|uniref:hypothetical protein n=1 Tax=Actinokineospora sp. TaxID=1872133 RepID=UPI004037F7DB
MKRLGTIAGAGVLLAVLTACATPQEDPIQPGQQPPPAAEPQAPEQSDEPDRQPARTPPSGGTAVPAAQVDVSALPQNYPVMVWTEDTGKAVGVVAQEGGCGKASAEVADQSGAQIVVKIVETTPAKSQMCTMDLRYPKLTVELAQPLGERKVVLQGEQRTE